MTCRVLGVYHQGFKVFYPWGLLVWIDIYKLGMDYIYHQYNTLKHPLGSKPLAFGGYNRTLNNGPFIFWGGTRMKFACSLLDPVHVR